MLFKKVKDYAKYKSRKLVRDYIIFSHAASPWMRNVKECQDEIATLNPPSNYLQSYRNQEVYFWSQIPKWIRKDYSKQTVKRCLDIGCGYGTLALYVKKLFNCEVYATDYIDAYLSPLSLVKKYNFFFSINNIELDAFPWDVKFDIIIFTEVLEHLNFYPVPTLKKIRALLSENGKLYLSTPDASQWGKVTKYYSHLDEMPLPKKGLPIVNDHVYVYSKDELLNVLKAAGLDVYRFGYSPGEESRHFNLTVTKKV